MRTEKEIMDLILNTAKEDKRIRAVYIDGSRTNINAPKDIFQDYDVVYVVTQTAPFIEEKSWIDRFGERLFMQYPDENDDFPSDKENIYGWLIQFADGNRIDLHVETIEHIMAHIYDDSLRKILLDKDNILPQLPAPSDKDYLVKKPTLSQYLCACNEFWWCLDNVAKGLWRDELTYAQDVINFHIRKELEKMLSWKIGVRTDFSVSVGKSGKYMKRWLSADEWQDYLATYSAAEEEACWSSVEKMCVLFEQTALYVGKQLDFNYNETEAKNCRSYLEHVRKLPKDAEEIY